LIPCDSAVIGTINSSYFKKKLQYQ
jgi:hypothetical protein